VQFTDLTSSLACTLSVTNSDFTSTDFTNESVKVSQEGEAAISLNFTATGSTDLEDNTRNLVASLSLEAGDTSNGTVTIDSNEPVTVSGTVVNPSTGISDVSVGSEDGSIFLSCVSASNSSGTSEESSLSQLENIIPAE